MGAIYSLILKKSFDTANNKVSFLSALFKFRSVYGLKRTFLTKVCSQESMIMTLGLKQKYRGSSRLLSWYLVISNPFQ